jgi:hypothetical protein
MKKIMVLPFVIAALHCSAQQKNRPQRDTLIKDVDDIGSVLLYNYHPNEDSVKAKCLQACVFIKFNISRSGKFVNVAYTKGTPVFIIDALTNAFIKSSSQVSLSNLKIISKETYILPLLYNYNWNCGFQHGVFETAEEKKLTESEKGILKERQANLKQDDKSLWNITNFSDGRYDKINCILLSPVSIGGIMF